MSLLNDALRKNRSESPGNPASAPLLKTDQKESGKNGARKRLWWIAVLGAALSGGLLFSYFYFIDPSDNNVQPFQYPADVALNAVAVETEAALDDPPPIPEEKAPVSSAPPPESPQSQTALSAASAPLGPESPELPESNRTLPETKPVKKVSLKHRTRRVASTPVAGASSPDAIEPTAANPPPHLARLYDRARLYHRQKRWDKAINLYREILSMDAGHFDAHFNLVSAYLQTGDYENAYIQAKQLLRQSPENSAVMLNLAAACIGTGKASKALELLEQVEQHPKAPLFEIYLHQGIAHRHLKDLAAAIACYEKAEKINPDDPRLLFNLAVAYDQHQNYPRAVDYYLYYLQSVKDEDALKQRRIEARLRQLRFAISAGAAGDEKRK